MKKPTRSNAPSPQKSTPKNSLPYEDFMALFFVVGLLLIDFLPYFKSYEIIAPQFLYLTVLNIAMGCFLYAHPSLHAKNLISIFKKSYIFKIYLAFILLSGVSIFMAQNVSLGLLSIAEILVVFTLFLNFTILFYNRLYLIYKVGFLIAVSVFFQAGAALYHFEIVARKTSLYDALNSEFLKGNTGNINVFSAGLLFKIPFIYAGIINYINWKRWFLIVTLTLATTLIFFINARASLLSLALITISFLIYFIKNNGLKKSVLYKLIYVLLPLVISYGTVNLIFKQAKLGERYVSTTERLKLINTSDKSIGRRLVFWNITLKMTKENPVLGIGLGNFRVESIPYDKSPLGFIPLHAHNDFLELTAETGVLNGCLYLLLFVFIGFVNLRRLISAKDIQERNIAFLALMLLIVYGIDAFFNFPFYRPTMQLCFCLLMVLTFVNVPLSTDQTRMNAKIIAGLIVLSIIPLYYTYYAYQTSHLEYLIQTDDINFQTSGVLNGDDVIQHQPKIPNVFLSSESFVEYAGIYYLREKKYEQAIQYLDSANTINPYRGRPDFYKSLVYAEMGDAEKAYATAKSAFYHNPNDSFYRRAINFAAAKRDTTAILKMYQTFSTSLKSARNWESAVGGLQQAGISKTNFDRFIKQGLIDFPKDSVVNQKINEMKITAYLVKGQELFDLGKHQEALQTYQLGLKIDPTNVFVFQNIGFYYYNQGKLAEAITNFTKALSLPGLVNGKTEFFLGLSFLRNGDQKSACKYFALANEKGYADAQRELANCK